MSKELPKSADLLQERENLKSKVQAIQAQKLRDIEEKVLGIEQSRKQVKNLDGLLKEARENLAYYENLRESGQLSEDELENFEKAKALMAEIEEKLKSHEEGIKENFSIPEVEEKISAEALKENENFDAKEAEKRKEKEVEKKISEWLKNMSEIFAEAKKLYQEEEGKNNGFENFKADLLSEFKNKKDVLPADFIRALELEGPYERAGEKRFEDFLKEHINEMGMFNFTKKSFLRKILNGEKLEQYKRCRDEFAKFIKETEPRWGDIVISNMANMMEKRGAIGRLKEIESFLHNQPPKLALSSGSIIGEEMEKLKDKEFVEKIKIILRGHNYKMF